MSNEEKTETHISKDGHVYSSIGKPLDSRMSNGLIRKVIAQEKEVEERPDSDGTTADIEVLSNASFATFVSVDSLVVNRFGVVCKVLDESARGRLACAI